MIFKKLFCNFCECARARTSLDRVNVVSLANPASFSVCLQTTGNIMNFCEVGLKISGVAPVASAAALLVDNATLSSVTVGYTERHTVAFLGSQDGVIRKVSVASPFQEKIPRKN